MAWRAPGPSRAASRPAGDERARRLEALARWQAAELARLRAMLAQVARRRTRKAAAGVGQMALPL